MKNIFLSIALVALFSLDILAQVPRVISYQGVLTDNQGNLLPDGNRTLTLKLYDNLFGDEIRLKKELEMCRIMYDDAIKIINNKTTGEKMRLFLRSISDYWNRRRLCLERSISITLGVNKLKELKDTANAKKT